MSKEEFQSKFRGSAIRRAKHTGLRRNAIVAIGNSEEPAFLPLLHKLATDEDPVIAETADWAIHRLNDLQHDPC